MADERLDWFPCYPSKLLGALAGMPPAQGYTYWIVCLRIYEVGGPCMDGLETIARRTGFNKRVTSDALDALFRGGKLARRDGGIFNPFADQVIRDSRSLFEKRKTAGRAGGLSSAEKRKQNQSNDPSKASAQVEQPSTHLQLQDSLFPSGNRPSGDSKPTIAAKAPTPLEVARKELFDRGKEILGLNAGGMIQQLLGAKHGNVSLARAAIEHASTTDNPREYIGAIMRGAGNGKTQSTGGNAFSGIASRIRHGSGGSDGGPSAASS